MSHTNILAAIQATPTTAHALGASCPDAAFQRLPYLALSPVGGLA